MSETLLLPLQNGDNTINFSRNAHFGQRLNRLWQVSICFLCGRGPVLSLWIDTALSYHPTWQALVLCVFSCPVSHAARPHGLQPPGSSVHGMLQVRILEWGCHALLQRIFPTQGSNPGLLHCRQILYIFHYIVLKKWTVKSKFEPVTIKIYKNIAPI